MKNTSSRRFSSTNFFNHYYYYEINFRRRVFRCFNVRRKIISVVGKFINFLFYVCLTYAKKSHTVPSLPFLLFHLLKKAIYRKSVH